MDVYELKAHLTEHVPNFVDPEIVDLEGEYFHYTPHWKLIKESGKFKGAKIDDNLDFTQKLLKSNPASEDLGVVFAYENLKDAQEEGFDLEIVKIRCKKAIKALHEQESFFGDLTSKLIQDELGGKVLDNFTPKTILILTTDIIDFNLIE